MSVYSGLATRALPDELLALAWRVGIIKLMNDDEWNLHDEAHGSLHRCWTAAVGTPEYNKNDWKTLERQIHRGCPSGCLVRDYAARLASGVTS